MPIKSIIVKKGDHEHRIIRKEYKEDVMMELVEKEVEKQREEKYKQLEFDFDIAKEYNVAPI